MPNPLPTYLITGLLGSGKTTLLQDLIRQKPANESWGIIINEFGEIDIDSGIIASATSSSPDSAIIVKFVVGGCICCSAQFSLKQAINELLKEHAIDRLFIEPTGLGHPAQVIDIIKSQSFYAPLSLQKTVCVITPAQLTKERWKKSQVMRDLVTLADLIILNKTDLASLTETENCTTLLKQYYPSHISIKSTSMGQTSLKEFISTHIKDRNENEGSSYFFKSFQATQIDSKQLAIKTDPSSHFKKQQQLPRNSALPGVVSSYAGYANTQEKAVATLLSLGWIWQDDIQFNRVKLKEWFSKHHSNLLRAKGILKTGKEWQLLQWSDGQLDFTDIAWRKDSRLECLFDEHESTAHSLSPQQLEEALQSCINPPRK